MAATARMEATKNSLLKIAGRIDILADQRERETGECDPEPE
jgi:hypothetical protein